LREKGHEAIFMRDSITTGSSDPLVCKAAKANDAILVACDGDMRQLVKRYGVSNGLYKKLSLLKLSCGHAQALNRLRQTMSLIEHEWVFSEEKTSRRLHVEIKNDVISTHR
jgi:predicted nuclease of predicted toxin-antitoxin system